MRQSLSRRWELGYAASAVLDLFGFGALVLSVIMEIPKIALQGRLPSVAGSIPTGESAKLRETDGCS